MFPNLNKSQQILSVSFCCYMYIKNADSQSFWILINIVIMASVWWCLCLFDWVLLHFSVVVIYVIKLRGLSHSQIYADIYSDIDQLLLIASKNIRNISLRSSLQKVTSLKYIYIFSAYFLLCSHRKSATFNSLRIHFADSFAMHTDKNVFPCLELTYFCKIKYSFQFHITNCTFVKTIMKIYLLLN